MKTKGLTTKILLGMFVGAICGVLLMHYAPAGFQPADKIEIVFQDGEKVETNIASEDKKEKLLDVFLDSGETGKAVAERSQKTGNIKIDNKEIALVGLQSYQAKEKIEQATNRQVVSVKLKDRYGLPKVIPPATQPFYVIGEMFMRLLRMLIIPLIISTILVGIAGLGSFSKIGKLGKHTFVFYFATMLLASTTGLILVNIIQPGSSLNWTVPAEAVGIAAEPPSVMNLLLRIIPENPIQAIATFDILGVLFFTIVIALAILQIGKHRVAPVFNFFEALNDLVYVLIGWLMRIAPIGIGGLIAYFLGVQDPSFLGSLLQSLGKFALCVFLGLLTHFVVLMLLLMWLGKYNPFVFLKRVSPMIATALGTDSSSATMPVTLTCVRDLGVSKRIAGFVVPVGATMNMDGTALYEAVSVLFFAQAFGVELTMTQQVIVAFTAMLAAVGAAGIPHAGLVTMAIVLTAVGLPITGIGLLLAIDRPLDMCRTVVNVTGDAVTSRVVQTWNPEISPEEDDIATEYAEVVPSAAHGDG